MRDRLLNVLLVVGLIILVALLCAIFDLNGLRGV